jgi:hypothetical protein
MTMPAIEPNDPVADRIARRVMFALELLDPVTKAVVRDGVTPSVAGLSSPLKGHTGRFVWFETGVPVKRDIVLSLAIENPMYAPPDAAKLKFSIPANDGHASPGLFLRQVELKITAAFVPAEGITGVASMIIETAGVPTPVVGAKSTLAFLHDEGQVFRTASVATTDENGAFVAFADDVDDIVPQMSSKDQAGDILAWLEISRGNNSPKYTGFLPLRRGRLTQLRKAISWTSLVDDPPKLTAHP